MLKSFSKAASSATSAATSAFSKNDASTSKEEEGESLTTVLKTEEERSALTILIADCSEAMRTVLEGAFDPDSASHVALDVVEKPAKDASPMTELLNDEAAAKQEQELAEKKAKEEKALAQRQKELSEESMQALKAAALRHFDDWRVAVIQRVGEVVNSRETAEQQSHQAKPKVEGRKDQAKNAVAPMKFPDLPEYDEGVQSAMSRLYPPIETSLSRLPEEQRALIIHSVLLLLLSLENYQAHSRILLLRLCTSLHLPVSFLASDESKVARVLLTAAESMSADDETKQAAEDGKTARKWKVGLATVAGAALIGITGGLAAPLLAAGIGSVMGGLGLGATAAAGYLGALAGSGVLVGGLFGAYGGRMTGKMMQQYAQEVEDFAFIPVRNFHQPRKIEKEYRRLRVSIGITGLPTNQDEVVEPWKVFGAQLESFALRWELEALMGLGNAVTTMITSTAWSYAKVEIIKRTLFGALYAGLWPLALLKVGKVIDNPFAIANNRAQKAGEVLADALINKAQGERPVTLVGYSLGAKVIFTCLRKLAERKAFGLVESVVLIGTPAPSTSGDWRMIRSVVSGRVVNVYSTNDYVLGYLYRSYSVQFGVAGLQAIEHVHGVENFDVSGIVSGHTSYKHLNGTILKRIGFEDVDPQGLKEEEEALEMQEVKEEMERERSQEESGETSENVSDDYVNNLEKEVEKKNERSYVAWTQEKLVAAGTSASSALEKAKSSFQGRSSKPAAEPVTRTETIFEKDEQPPILPMRPKAD